MVNRTLVFVAIALALPALLFVAADSNDESVDLESNGSIDAQAGGSSDDTDKRATDATGDKTTNESDATEPAVHPDNPYGQDTLVVSLNDSATERNVTPLVVDALAYWERHSETHAGYPIEYDLRANATNADVHIQFERDIRTCGAMVSETTLACAPYVTDEPADTAEITIEGGYTNESTKTILKHELGHTLGLDHDDDPQHIMNAELIAVPRVLDPHIVWQTHSHDLETVREQVTHGVGYYETYSQEHLNASFELGEVSDSGVRVAGVSDLTIIVSDDRNACGDPAYVSCAEIGPTPLGGSEYVITLADPPTDATGWLVGDLLVTYLHLDDRPAVFEEYDRDEATGEWWNASATAD